MSREKHQDIRIGTLVKGGEETVRMIQQLLPLGFESFSITHWQKLDASVLKKTAPALPAVLAGKATVSSLSVFGNPLGDQEVDDLTRKAWEDAIDIAEDFGCDLVTGFTGRVRGVSVPESLGRFKEVWRPLADRAGERGVRIAFENCNMGGSWKTGDWNIAFQPAAWELIFDVLPDRHVGLQWEPAHQLVQLIDPMPQLRHWAERILCVHGKDAVVYHDVIREHGVLGSVPFVHHTMPGKGDSNWAHIISRLRQNGFQGSIDIEGWHDPDLNGDLEMTGQVFALEYLKSCRGGTFIPNPSP